MATKSGAKLILKFKIGNVAGHFMMIDFLVPFAKHYVLHIS
jgi:hypothetical protein